MKRKQAFYEIGQGKFAVEAQENFEKAQTLAMESNQPITLTMKIKVMAPPEGDRFGKTQFSIQHSLPAKKSIEFTTEYEGGVAIRDGETIDGLNQMDLFVKDEEKNPKP